MSQILNISTGLIRPLPGQPRQYFEPKALQELADSIAEHGQSTPAWVTPLEDGSYQLIAGERRWRACQLAGIPTLRAEVRPGLSEADQYLQSVMENFGRKDCTTMETARSVGKMLELYGNDLKKVANVFARSTAWVQQYSYLLRLHPDVAARLDPPNASLKLGVAISLANLHPDVQLRLADQLATKGLSHKAALSFVRGQVTPEMSNASRGRHRRPSDDFEILKRFLTSLGPQAQAILDLGPARISSMFAHRDATQLAAVKAVLRKRVDQLRDLERML